MQLPLKCWSILLLAVIIIGAAANDCCQVNGTRRQNFLEKLFDKIITEDYNHQQGPSDDEVQFINVSFLFYSIPQVLFARMEFEAEFLIRISWRDNRLNTDQLLANNNTKGMKFIGVPKITAQHMWIPSIFYPNCNHCAGKRACSSTHSLTFHPGTKSFYTFYRDTMTFACAFDLSSFPFDSHECSVSLQVAERFTGAKLKLNDVVFFDFPLDQMVKSGMPPEFHFRSLSVKQKCSQRSPVVSSPADRCLQYDIRIERIASHHLMLVFCPTTVIVMISWISFWISAEACAPRISLGLTSLLTLTTQFSNEQKTLPPVAYIKAIDVWMLMCVFMVFGSLLEFTLAHTWRCPMKNAHISETVGEGPNMLKRRRLFDVNNPRSVNTFMDVTKATPPKTKIKRQEVHWLDAKSRMAFPVVFILFNCVYWPCYAR